MSKLFLLCNKYNTNSMSKKLATQFDVYRTVGSQKVIGQRKHNTTYEKEILTEDWPCEIDILLFHRSEKKDIKDFESKIKFKTKFMFSSEKISVDDIEYYSQIDPSTIVIPKAFIPGTVYLSSHEISQLKQVIDSGSGIYIPAFCRVKSTVSSIYLQKLLIMHHIFLAAWKSKNGIDFESQSGVVKRAIEIMGLDTDLPSINKYIYDWTQNFMYSEIIHEMGWINFASEIYSEYDKIVSNSKINKLSGRIDNTKEILNSLRTDPKGVSTNAPGVCASIIELTKLLSNPIISKQTSFFEGRRHEINHYFLKPKLIIYIDGLIEDFKAESDIAVIISEIEKVRENLELMREDLNKFLESYKLAMSPSTLAHELFPNLTSEYKIYIEEILDISWLYRCSIEQKIKSMKSYIKETKENTKNLEKIIKIIKGNQKIIRKELPSLLNEISDGLQKLSEQLSKLNTDGYIYCDK